MSLLKWFSKPTLERWHRDRNLFGWISETLEISIGSACSVITWRFVVQNESIRETDRENDSVGVYLPRNQRTRANLGSQHQINGQLAVKQTAAGDFLLHPTPELMLCCCLIFGCCVSSFAHRRQDEDGLQLVVYAVFLVGAIVVGYGLEASANLILLGYVPWAMCVAMAASLSGHHFYRLRRLDSGMKRKDEEKDRPLK